MKITLIRNAGGHKAGDTVDLDKITAEWFIDHGYADTSETPEGDQYHDELVNTDERHHGEAIDLDRMGVTSINDGDAFTEDTETATTGAGAFDPAEHTVDEVKAYLDSADDTERDRVLAAERGGKARSSLIG